MKSNYLIIGLVALATAATIFELAANDPDPRQHVRIIDVPHLTHADALRLGIEPLDQSQPGDLYRASVEVPHGPVTAYASQLSPEDLATRHSALATPKEVKPAPGRTKPSSPEKHLVQTARGTTLSRAELAAEVRAALPKLPKAEVDAAVWIIWRESGGRTTAKSPRSSSHGLNGFISRSWVSMTKRHGIKHSLEPRAQILALYHYCKDRYGSLTAARSFHRKRGWY